MSALKFLQKCEGRNGQTKGSQAMRLQRGKVIKLASRLIIHFVSEIDLVAKHVIMCGRFYGEKEAVLIS